MLLVNKLRLGIMILGYTASSGIPYTLADLASVLHISYILVPRLSSHFHQSQPSLKEPLPISTFSQVKMLTRYTSIQYQASPTYFQCPQTTALVLLYTI